MGIDGLLPFVASASEEVHVSTFAGCKLAVDASGWLHRGAIACASELASGVPTDKYMNYAVRLVAFLRRLNIEPVVVFDGAKLPMKVRTDAQRRQDRDNALEKGRECRARGADGEKHWRRAVRITPEMSRRLLQELRRKDVACIVAPYEADAQMCFLVENGECAAAISEDSDLLAYRCPRVLYKFSADTGYARLHVYDKLRNATFAKSQLFDGTVGWENEWQDWHDGLFTDMCILAGCDYLESLPGIGIKKAHAVLRKYRSAERALTSLYRKSVLNGNKALDVDKEQLLEITRVHTELFHRCRQVFRHALVWDSRAGAVVPLRPLPPSLDTTKVEDIIGPSIEPRLAKLLCETGILLQDTSTAQDASTIPTEQALPEDPASSILTADACADDAVEKDRPGLVAIPTAQQADHLDKGKAPHSKPPRESPVLPPALSVPWSGKNIPPQLRQSAFFAPKENSQTQSSTHTLLSNVEISKRLRALQQVPEVNGHSCGENLDLEKRKGAPDQAVAEWCCQRTATSRSGEGHQSTQRSADMPPVRQSVSACSISPKRRPDGTRASRGLVLPVSGPPKTDPKLLHRFLATKKR